MEKKYPKDYNWTSMMPEMFRIFSVPVSGYMFFYILGIVIGAMAILWLSGKEKLDTVEMAAFILLGIVCGWLGSRLLGSAFHQIARLGKAAALIPEYSGRIFKPAALSLEPSPPLCSLPFCTRGRFSKKNTAACGTSP